MASCPECDADIDIDEYDVDRGDTVDCPECSAQLEVVSLSPLELDLADDDDDDDDFGRRDEEEEDDEEESEEDEGWDE